MRRFPCGAKCFVDPGAPGGGDEDLLPAGAPAPSAARPAPAARRHPADEGPLEIVCGFCKCKVTSTRGQVIALSDDAENYRESALTIKNLRREVSDLKAEVLALKAPSEARPGGRTTLV